MHHLKGWALPALIIVAMLIVGCGSQHVTSTTAHITLNPLPRPTVATVKAQAHDCLPSDIAMQCELPVEPLPTGVAHRVAAHFTADAARMVGTYGVDFAWGGPRSCAAMKSLGAHFAISYFSNDPSKNWTPALVNEFHGCGIATVGGWESSAQRATQGFAAGVADAHSAAREAGAVGNIARPLWFAIDFDATGPDVLPYFQGVHSVLGARTEAYGSYRAILYLYQHGVVGHQNFQTYAWSGGLWLPSSIAPLEQYLNGSSFDNDRAIAADYGQWPYTATKVAVKHRPKPKAKKVRSRTSAAQHYGRYDNRPHRIHGHSLRERANVERWDAKNCRRPVRRPVCRTTRRYLTLILGRDQHVYRHQSRKARAKYHTPGRIQGLTHRINNPHGVVMRWL